MLSPSVVDVPGVVRAAVIGFVCVILATAAAPRVASGQVAHSPRASAEVIDGGPSRAESARAERELKGRLDSGMPAGALATPIRVRLTAQERRDLEGGPKLDAGRLRVGIVKAVGKRVAFGAADVAGLGSERRVAGGVLAATAEGEFVWAASLRSDGAAGLRVHFTELDLPPGAELYVHASNGEAFGPYTGRGPDGSGELWANTVMADEAVVQLRGRAEDLSSASLVIADVGHVGPQFVAELDPSPQPFCSNNAACAENATCYDQTPADAAKQAVALMQWVSGAYLYACSGGLIADTDPSSQIPYFLSANHCVSRKREAQVLECFFQYQAACGVTACPPRTGFPRTLGATVKATGNGSDFSLLQLSQSPPAGSVLLGWNSTPVASTEGAALYRISHPHASPQAFSEHSVSTTAAQCTGWPRGAWIYSRDVVGTTQGGSSGSPVVNAAGEIVGQLSGGCGYNISDPCDNVLNATVDGAFAAYFDKVAPFLAPTPAPPAEICNDGVDNDGDAAVDCNDADCAAHPSCSVCSPVGASCTSNGQCCSGKCRGPAGGSICR